ERLPLGRPLGRPAAWAPGRVAGKSGRADQAFEFFRQRLAVRCRNTGCEPDLMQQAVLAVEGEQERAHGSRARAGAESADHAVRAAIVLNLLGGRALAGPIRQVASFRDDAVEGRAGSREPAFRLRAILRCRRQANAVGTEMLAGKLLQRAP